MARYLPGKLRKTTEKVSQDNRWTNKICNRCFPNETLQSLDYILLAKEYQE